MANFPSNFKVLAFQQDTVRAVNTAVAMRVYCKAPATTHTTPAIGITNTAFSLYTGSTVKDASFATAGTATLGAGMGTMGALQDTINNTGFWEARLVASVRSDVTFITSSGILVDIAEADAGGLAVRSEAGAAVYWETTTGFKASACIGLESESGGRFLARRSDSTVWFSHKVRDTAVLSQVTSPTTPVFQPYDFVNFLSAVDLGNTSTTLTSSFSVYAESQGGTTRLLRGPMVGTASGAPGSFTFSDPPIFGNPGERIVVEVSSADIVAPTMTVYGGRGRWTS